MRHRVLGRNARSLKARALRTRRRCARSGIEYLLFGGSRPEPASRDFISVLSIGGNIIKINYISCRRASCSGCAGGGGGKGGRDAQRSHGHHTSVQRTSIFVQINKRVLIKISHPRSYIKMNGFPLVRASTRASRPSRKKCPMDGAALYKTCLFVHIRTPHMHSHICK